MFTNSTGNDVWLRSGHTAFIYLLKEAMLLVGNGCACLRELAALLPQSSPHVLLLQQGVQLCQRVQDLLRNTNTYLEAMDQYGTIPSMHLGM